MIEKNKKVFIGCSSNDSIDSKYLLFAKDIADIFSRNGYDLIFGASSCGMMGECSNVFSKNHKSIYSYTVSKYFDDLKNIKSKEKYIYDTTFERTKGLYSDANFILFLPGGTGTIAEVFSILEENRTFNQKKMVLLYNYDGYYDKLLDLINYCIENRFNDKTIWNYIRIINSIDELNNIINEINNKIVMEG